MKHTKHFLPAIIMVVLTCLALRPIERSDQNTIPQNINPGIKYFIEDPEEDDGFRVIRYKLIFNPTPPSDDAHQTNKQDKVLERYGQ